MNYYNKIKKELINNEITKKAKDYSKNRSDLNTYYNVGKMLSEAGKRYGKSILKEYSIRLSQKLNNKYDVSYLNKMKKFYLLIQKLATLSPKLSYNHYVELLSIKDITEIKYYIKIVENKNISIRQLREKIKSKEYERLPESTKEKLISNESCKLTELVKNPVVIKTNKNYENVSEKLLQKIILEDIPTFLEELGNGFTFIKNEYKIKLGDRYNYIDLLLFNIDYNCCVVVELKNEHIGQIQIYMNYIDAHLRKFNQDKTIGIILCKKENKYVIEYCSDTRIIERKYILVE